MTPRLAWAFLDNTGGSAGQFLQIGAGARSLGMGDAFCAVAEGPDALYWNPAGLSGMKRPAFAYTRSEIAGSMRHDYGVYAHPVSALKGTLGISLTYLVQDSLPIITNTNLVVGRFNPHSESLALAYATKFQSGEFRSAREYFGEYWNVPGVDRPMGRSFEPWAGAVMLGLAVKVVRENFYIRNATAFVFDGGVIFRPDYLKGLTLGFAFRNAGEKMKFINTGQLNPVELDAGAAYDWPLKRSRLLTAVGVGLPYFGAPEGRFGMEYSMPVTKNLGAALRFGYKSRTFDDLDPVTGVTAGVGFTMYRAKLDVAIQPMAEFGVHYKVSLGYRF
ncbi:MAG: hypothetical protein HY748_11840 [Elusimicrobia bacterium]|nr:hypothetical protein [Elusimicrobiota bacterium]